MSDTLVERYITGDDYDRAINGKYWRGQTFTIGNTGENADHNITSVKLFVYKDGSPGAFDIAIRAVDGSHLATGGDLTTGSTSGDTLPTSSPYEWREITLTPYGLSASTEYALIASAPAGDTSNRVFWRVDSSSPGYTGGWQLESGDSGASWSGATEYDRLFEEYGIFPVTGQYLQPTRYW